MFHTKVSVLKGVHFDILQTYVKVYIEPLIIEA